MLPLFALGRRGFTKPRIRVKCAMLTLASFSLSIKAPNATRVLENTPNREAVTAGVGKVANEHKGKDWGPRLEFLLFFSSLIDCSDNAVLKLP